MASWPVSGPDIAGFRDAQDRLIDQMGTDVTFRTPQPRQYPPGTQLDPETGRPYDPTIRPTSAGYDETVVRCSVAIRPIRPGRQSRGEDTADRSGMRREEGMALTYKVVDHPRAKDATEVVVNGLAYKVTEIMPDGLTEVQRYIVFLEAK